LNDVGHQFSVCRESATKIIIARTRNPIIACASGENRGEHAFERRPPDDKGNGRFSQITILQGPESENGGSLTGVGTFFEKRGAAWVAHLGEAEVVPSPAQSFSALLV
jgi:hypothetical protein